MPEKFRPRLSAGFAIALAVLPLIIGGLAMWWYASEAPKVPIIELEFAGTATAARGIVDNLAEKHGSVDTDDAVRQLRAAVDADWLLIAAYGIATVLACWLGLHVFGTPRGRIIAMAAVGATLLAVVADLVENGLLLFGLSRLRDSGDLPFAGAAAAASIKFATLLPAVLVALTAIAVTLRRAVGALLPRQRSKRTDPEAEAPVTIPPPPIMTAAEEYWPKGEPPRNRDDSMPGSRWDYGASVPRTRPPAAVGFCVSGGGIRSACVTFGALEALRSELLKARYLVSVSGGGYAAGALQLALQPLPGANAPSATPHDVMTASSVELDHVRRHGDYLAEGAGQWLVALLVILRGVTVSLVLTGAAVTVVGIALSHMYDIAPFVELSKLQSKTRLGDVAAALSAPALWAVVGGLAVALTAWLLGRFVTSERLRRVRHVVEVASLGVATAVAVFAVAVPVLVWASMVWAPDALGIAERDAGVAEGVSAGLGTVLMTYGAALAGILWRQRKKIGSFKLPFTKAKDKDEPETLATRVANGAVQYAIVWGVLLALAVVYLFILGFTTATATQWSRVWVVGLPVVMAVVALQLDQTWLSLHPFYRRRLASAFSVRRVQHDDRTAALAYDFDGEVTALTTHGKRSTDAAGAPNFPQLIVAAAANLSGQERTPPGRRAVSYTLSHDYIGGPDVGYVSTAHAEAVSPRRLRMDLTVQSAVAVSGAAFASAMGGQARAIQTLFALSNARLGTWLPNPAVIDRGEQASDWRIPGLPSARRLSYQLREIFGEFPYDERLLYITDGGHYENLGLVELLRHGCKTVFCIDGSGDSPPFATTLAQAITLAREELGVIIRLDNPLDAVPGGAQPLDPDKTLASLNSRLSRGAILTGTIEYPAKLSFDDGTVGSKGRLYLAKGLLTPTTPFELLSYAVSHDEFPRDSTGDQWFDHAQFNAYLALGRHIGAEALAIATAERSVGRRALWPPSSWFNSSAVLMA